MRRPGVILLLLIACGLPLGGCQNMNNQQSGALMGAGGGALLGGLSGRLIGGNNTGAAVGALVGALAGGFAGSVIGQNLDERDRQRAQQATMQVLAQPVQAPPVAPGRSYAPPRARAPQATWRSEKNPTQGSATLVSVDRPAAGTGECRTVREVAYIGGKEVVQNSRYCEGGNGQWQPAT
ncbi:hypothetical protein E2C06_22430 [Dankookia rubra]|uniref:Glycine zipper domain-containing protein n=1 Tax=Dankookia rubra TaxID=1442381 RepID=A0A4R5QBB6_9PROT|nr:glycine zipper domain-containing protein [Dankookia rubra]TDH60382.1 hypothetical protein E2C06_22430 [Dankookia rubra]